MKHYDYQAFKAVPLGTNFEGVALDGFGRHQSAAAMRLSEAESVGKKLAELVEKNTITPEMADYLGALPLDKVFEVNRIISNTLKAHLEGSGANAYLSNDGFNAALAKYDLPPMTAER